MNMKKKLLILSLGLAASLQAQEAPAAQAAPTESTPAAVTKPVKTQAAPATAPTTQPAEAAPAAQAAEASQPAEATAAQSAVEQAAAQTAQAESAATEQATVSDTTAAATETMATAADSTSEAAAAPAQTAEATPAEQPAAETAPVAEPAVADTTNAAEAIPADSAAIQAAPAEVAVNAAAPAADPLNILHGSAYNTVGNEAAASTIFGNLATPRKMFGTKAVYFEPIAERAVVSFGNSNTYFLAFDNSDDLGILTAGMSFGKFGFSVDGSLGKQWIDVEQADGAEQSAIKTQGGTMAGATASLLAGPVDIVLSGHYIKPVTETYAEAPTAIVEPKAGAANGKLAISYSGDVISWSAGADILRNDSKLKTTTRFYQVVDGVNKLATVKTSLSDTSSRFEVTPNFNIGGAVLKAEDAKVYLGVNTRFPMVIYDEIDEIVDKHQKAAAYLTPNIFGEVLLSQYFMAFGGASYDWNALSYEKKEIGKYSEESKETETGKATVNLGARFQYNRVALEMAFTKQFLQNPFGSFSNTDEIGVSLGAFILF